MEGLRVSKLEEGHQWGKNTSSRDKVHWGRRPPYIVRGTIQPLPPTPAPQRAVLPLGQRYYRFASGTTVPSRGTAAGPRAVLPRWSGRYYRTRAVLPPTAAASTVKPDTEKDPSNRGGTSTKPQRYYGWGLQRYYRCGAVLPLVAPKRYYRSGPRYYRWDQRGHTERGERAHQRSGKARRVCKGSVRDDSTLAFPKRTSS